MPVHQTRWFWVLGSCVLLARGLHAQGPVTLSEVIGAFQADADVRTAGLAWTTGGSLPVTWSSESPVPAEAYMIREGLTMQRTGSLPVLVGEGPATEMTVLALGTKDGIQRTSFIFSLDALPLDRVEQSLRDDGVELKPLKCDRSTEGAIWGNAVHVVRVPGKTASALHENWNCGADGCMATLSLLYRRADVESVECAGGI